MDELSNTPLDPQASAADVPSQDGSTDEPDLQIHDALARIAQGDLDFKINGGRAGLTSQDRQLLLQKALKRPGFIGGQLV